MPILPLEEAMFHPGPLPPAPPDPPAENPPLGDPLIPRLAHWVDIYYYLLAEGK